MDFDGTIDGDIVAIYIHTYIYIYMGLVSYVGIPKKNTGFNIQLIY